MSNRRLTCSVALPDVDVDESVGHQEGSGAGINFIEEVKRLRAKHKEEGNSNSKVGWRILVCFHVCTMMFSCSKYIIPSVFSHCDSITQFFIKVFVCYLILNSFVNYLLTIHCDVGFYKTKDRRHFLLEHNDIPSEQVVQRLDINGNGNKRDDSVYKIPDEEENTWTYCVKCSIQVPPRAFHCNYCKTCILKRDHHCYVVGNCIGFKNQRYFVIMNFYALVSGLLCLYLTIKFGRSVVFQELTSYSDFVLPLTVIRYIFGYISAFNALIIIHVYLNFLFIMFGFIYFSSQMAIIIRGITLYEYHKRVPIQTSQSVNENFRSVFGSFWALNFLFPMTFVLRQPGDGTCWDGINIIEKVRRID